MGPPGRAAIPTELGIILEAVCCPASDKSMEQNLAAPCVQVHANVLSHDRLQGFQLFQLICEASEGDRDASSAGVRKVTKTFSFLQYLL